MKDVDNIITEILEAEQIILDKQKFVTDKRKKLLEIVKKEGNQESPSNHKKVTLNERKKFDWNTFKLRKFIKDNDLVESNFINISTITKTTIDKDMIYKFLKDVPEFEKELLNEIGRMSITKYIKIEEL